QNGDKSGPESESWKRHAILPFCYADQRLEAAAAFVMLAPFQSWAGRRKLPFISIQPARIYKQELADHRQVIGTSARKGPVRGRPHLARKENVVKRQTRWSEPGRPSRFQLAARYGDL